MIIGFINVLLLIGLISGCTGDSGKKDAGESEEQATSSEEDEKAQPSLATDDVLAVKSFLALGADTPSSTSTQANTEYSCNASWRALRVARDGSSLSTIGTSKGPDYWNKIHSDILDTDTALTASDRSYLTNFSSNAYPVDDSVLLIPMLKGTTKSGEKFSAAPASISDIAWLKVNGITMSADQYQFAHAGLLHLTQQPPEGKNISKFYQAVVDTDNVRENSPYAYVLTMKFTARTTDYKSKNLAELAKKERFLETTPRSLSETELTRMSRAARKAIKARGEKPHVVATIKCTPKEITSQTSTQDTGS